MMALRALRAVAEGNTDLTQVQSAVRAVEDCQSDMDAYLDALADDFEEADVPGARERDNQAHRAV